MLAARDRYDFEDPAVDDSDYCRLGASYVHHDDSSFGSGDRLIGCDFCSQIDASIRAVSPDRHSVVDPGNRPASGVGHDDALRYDSGEQATFGINAGRRWFCRSLSCRRTCIDNLPRPVRCVRPGDATRFLGADFDLALVCSCKLAGLVAGSHRRVGRRDKVAGSLTTVPVASPTQTRTSSPTALSP